MNYFIDTDVCVIGAGHAGCEAALACARLALLRAAAQAVASGLALMGVSAPEHM